MALPESLRRRIPVLLRLITLGSRFLLIFFLARLLSPAEVGLYGLITAMSGYAVLALGFDFYTYSTRQIIRSPQGERRTILRSQVTFSALLYLIGYPLMCLLFVFELLPWTMLIWFLLLVPLEHLGLELDRVLIAMSDQLGASIGMFVRQATTPLLVVPLMVFIPALHSLNVVLGAWVFFDALGIGVGFWFLRRHLKDSEAPRIDWAWIKRGIVVAIPFLIGTLCLRALFTVDRQLVAVLTDFTVLGAYTLFMSIAAGMTQVIGTGVHQFIYPRLVASAHQGDRTEFRAAFKKLTIQTVVVAAIITIAVILLEPVLLWFVGGGIYEQYSWMLPWALIVTAIYNLSLIPHFGLYAVDADKAILWSTVAALAAFVATFAFSQGYGPVVRVLIALGASCVTLLIAKGAALTRRRGQHWR